MKRILCQLLTVGGVAVLAQVLTPACAENDQSIYIRQTMAPPTNRTQGGGCSYTSDPTQPALFEGTLDVSATDSYVAVLLVGGQLRERGETLNARAESNRAHLNGAVVRVTEANGAVIGEFTSSGTGFVDPQVSQTASFGLMMVTLIDGPTAERIRGSFAPGQTKLILANVKAFGTTLGGVDLESGEYQFPIRVCKGCLIVPADDPAVNGPDCSLPLTTQGAGAGAVTLPCRAGQDERTPCQLCADEAHPACKGLPVP